MLMSSVLKNHHIVLSDYLVEKSNLLWYDAKGLFYILGKFS